MGQRPQRDSGLPQVRVHLLLFVVEHVELKELRLQVPVQVRIHRDGVRPEVMEVGVLAVVNGGSGVVGEVKELVDDIGARLPGASRLKAGAAADGDEELVPVAGRWRRLRRNDTSENLHLLRCVYTVGVSSCSCI